MTPKYRTDIDGLRAIAVLSVLFFHLGGSLFSGGYVGVDIFFVISGFLITTIIVREVANNDFSIIRFYERRFRRILPALTVVTLVSLTGGSLLLAPNNLIDLGQSAIATALFSSNILFYFESGYFDGPAEMKPLLHTWSLAVEEQYYIFFPLLLVLIAKVDTRHYLKWLIILGSLSFAACMIVTNIDSSAAFYLIITRAWELFIGSILALRVLPIPHNRRAREIMSILGMILIAYSVFHYTSDTIFPGIAAVVPTIGAALIIQSGVGGQSLVSSFLSLRPMVFTGLISYSLYLWHWPLIVFTKIYSIKEPSETVLAGMLGVIFILSILSWRYVETPFRKRILLRSKWSLLGASALVSLTIICYGLVFLIQDGLPNRYGVTIANNVGTIDPEWDHWRSCEGVVKKVKNDQNLCDIGITSGDVSFIFWGDSHARALASGVNLSAKNQRVRGKIATGIACPPLISIERPNRTSCHKFNQAVIKYISNSPGIEVVILAARWALSTKGVRYKQESGRQVKLVDLQSPLSKNLSNEVLFEIGLTRTINKLHSLGKRVVIVTPVPEVGIDVPSSYFVSAVTGRDVNSLLSPTTIEYAQRTKEVSEIFQKLSGAYSIHMIKAEEYLCNEDYCNVVAGKIPLYRDDDHLSTFGSKYLSNAFDEVFKELAQLKF